MHRGEACYSVIFTYDRALMALIKDFRFIKYSATHRAFYVFARHWSLTELIGALAGKGIGVTYGKFLKAEKLKEEVAGVPVDTAGNEKLLDDYISYLLGLRLSESTINTYSNFASNFIQFITGTSLEAVSNDTVRLFVEHEVKQKHYTISSHRQLISAIKHFGALFLESSIDIDSLHRPRKSSYLPTVLSKEEVIDLLRFTKNLKHRAVLALLYSSGLRIGELIDLRLHMINIDRRQLFVKNSKGRKDRVVMLAESFIPLFKNYYFTYRPEVYFVEHPKGGPYTAGSVRQFLKQSCKAAGITKRVTPHTLRHSYATHLIENGVGLRYVQDLLGHAKPETTMIYTHVAQKDLLQIRSPLDTALAALTKSDKDVPKLPFSDNISG